MAPRASTSNLGVLSVINHGAAAIDGLQKIGIVNVARVHQIHVTPQQSLKRICQLGPAAATRPVVVLVELNQKVKVAGIGIKPSACSGAEQLQMCHTIELAQRSDVRQLLGQ